MQRGDVTAPGFVRLCIQCKTRFIRKYQRIVLSPRLLVGLFCIGMVLGLVARSLMPGAAYGGAGNLAQMDPLSIVHPRAETAHAWTVMVSADGNVQLEKL